IFDVANHKFGKCRQRPSQEFDVNRKVAFLKNLGQIPVVHGRRHALPGVKTEYVKFDAGRPAGKFSDMAHVDEPGAASDAEFDNGDRLKPRFFRSLGCEQNWIRVLLPDDQIKIYLCTVGSEQRNEKGEEIEMNWFRTSFNKYLPKFLAREEAPQNVIIHL